MFKTLLRSDWRAGEWRVPLLALVLAVASLATVGLLADRVRVALETRAHSLLGADLRIAGTRPLADDLEHRAHALGLRTLRSYTFPSMVAVGERTLLARLDAQQTGYPLRGGMEIDRGQGARRVSAIPEAGTVWLELTALRRLGAEIGAEIDIGERTFRIAAVLLRADDTVAGFSGFAPRVLMNAADLPSTGLMQYGSRISYGFMVAGAQPAVEAFRAAVEPGLSGGEKLESVRDARPEIRTALERAEHFLGLAALATAMLAGAAMALAARRYVTRHLDAGAILRCLGASGRQLVVLAAAQVLTVGVAGVALGGLAGYAAQWLLVETVPLLQGAALPPPGWGPVLRAAASGLVLLLGFAFLPLTRLAKVPPLRVLRHELGLPDRRAWLVYAGAALVMGGLFLCQAGSLRLGGFVLAAMVVGVGGFALVAYGGLRVLHAGLRHAGPHWRYAAGTLLRSGGGTVFQIAALAVGGMALLLLTLVRGDLLRSWEATLPPDTPNHFLVNVQPGQRAAIASEFTQRGLPAPDWMPMVRGRLVEINGRAVGPQDYPDSRAQALVAREFNLSYAEHMPAWNKTVGGQWWGSCGEACVQAQWSVERGIAETLGIHLGDELVYDLAGSRVSARVTHLREVKWDSMRVNFFVIASPDVLRDFPATYLSSVHVPPDQSALADVIARAYPNLVLVDTGAAIAQVREIIDQIAAAASLLFTFTLLSGLVVLYAALLATQDARRHEAAVLRVLGAQGGWLRRVHQREFILLGGLAGGLSAAAAVLAGGGLAQAVLDIPYHPGWGVWVAGVGGGIVAVSLAGQWVMRTALRSAPLPELRATA